MGRKEKEKDKVNIGGSADAFLCWDECVWIHFISGLERMINLTTCQNNLRQHSPVNCISFLVGRGNACPSLEVSRSIKMKVFMSSNRKMMLNFPLLRLPGWNIFNSSWFILLSREDVEWCIKAWRKWVRLWPQHSESPRKTLYEPPKYGPALTHRNMQTFTQMVSRVLYICSLSFSPTYLHIHTC